MNEMDMVNEPVTFKVGPVSIMVRRVSSAKRRAITQAVITEQMIEQFRQRAATAYPDDASRRADHIEKAMMSMPSGKAMADLVSEHTPIEAVNRIVAEATGNAMTPAQVDAIMDEASVDEVRAVLMHIRGKKNSTSPTVNGAGSAG